MYEAIKKALLETDISESCPCEFETLCENNDCFLIQAAEAIKSLEQTVAYLLTLNNKLAIELRESLNLKETLYGTDQEPGRI